MSYQLLKALHILFAASCYTLFFLRGIWSLNNPAITQQRWLKIVPHAVDTLLLISAIALAFIIGQFPFIDAWLTAKVIVLLLYIGLGFIALHKDTSKTIRLFAWLAAQAAFAYIVLVAINHHPFPWSITASGQ
jgi:uncharacterized membrane protein SirB2